MSTTPVQLNSQGNSARTARRWYSPTVIAYDQTIRRRFTEAGRGRRLATGREQAAVRGTLTQGLSEMCRQGGYGTKGAITSRGRAGVSVGFARKPGSDYRRGND